LHNILTADINQYYKQENAHTKVQFMTSIILLHVSAPAGHPQGFS